KRVVGFERHTTLKNSIARQAVANLLSNAEATCWGFHAAFFRPDSKSGRGHRVTTDWRLVFHHGKALIANRNVNIFHFWLNTHAEWRIKAFTARRKEQLPVCARVCIRSARR